MSETSHLKCPCQQCGEPIEFPAGGVGQSIPCPHCGEQTTLLVAADVEPSDESAAPGEPSHVAHPLEDVSSELPADDSRPGSKRKVLWIALPLLALAVAATFLIVKGRMANPRHPAANGDRVATNLNPAPVAASAPAPAPATPKSIDELKAGPITLEKARGSSLIYAVGVLRNDSGHQRFGVTLELELTDARGNKAGTAKDYRAVLEPRQEWRFRALVLDSKAVSAKVAAIREEE